MHSVAGVQVVVEARFDSQAYLDLGRSLCQWALSEGDISQWESNQWGVTGMSSERLVMSCVCMCVRARVCVYVCVRVCVRASSLAYLIMYRHESVLSVSKVPSPVSMPKYAHVCDGVCWLLTCIVVRVSRDASTDGGCNWRGRDGGGRSGRAEGVGRSVRVSGRIDATDLAAG